MATLTTREQSLDERDRAAHQLEEALEQERRLAGTYEQSIGTPRELDVYIHLREARKRVSACDKWLHWVDDEDVIPAPPAEQVELEEVVPF
jgi:hypothetical protein